MNRDARDRSDRALLRNPYDPIGGREIRFHDTRLTRDCSIEEDREEEKLDQHEDSRNRSTQ